LSACAYLQASSLPLAKPEEAAYRARRAADREAALRALPTYQEQERESKDGGRGTAQLLGIPVAVPFVGTFAGAIAVSQAVRIASGLAPYATGCGSLANPSQIKAAAGSGLERKEVGGVKAGSLT
jgi:hypothetical protein